MRVSPRIQLRPSLPGPPPPGSLRASNFSIVFLERGSSAHTGAGCAAIYLTSTELESKRQTVPSLDAPKSHSYGELFERFSVFAGPGRPSEAGRSSLVAQPFLDVLLGCLFLWEASRFRLKKTPSTYPSGQSSSPKALTAKPQCPPAGQIPSPETSALQSLETRRTQCQLRSQLPETAP